MTGISWFPEGWAHTFFVWKGILALIGTILLVAHMARKREPMTLGQTLRYLSLLYLAVLITGASVEQSNQDAVVNYRNLAAIPGVALLIVAACVSLYESRHKH
jgi:uncharacterized membrane protein YeiB